MVGLLRHRHYNLLCRVRRVPCPVVFCFLAWTGRVRNSIFVWRAYVVAYLSSKYLFHFN